MNQRVQGALGALALVGAGWLMGAAGDGEVRGRRFVLEDERGRTCMTMDATDGCPQIRMHDPEAGPGSVRVSLTYAAGTSWLAFFGDNGKMTAVLTAGADRHGLTFFGRDGRAEIGGK